MMLKDYMSYMNNGDFEGIASLYTEDCHFNDGGVLTI